MSQAYLLLTGQVDPLKLCEYYNLGRGYVLENYPLALLSKRLASIGKSVKPGTRLEVVVIKTGIKNEKVGNKYRLIQEYLDDPNSMELDYMHYYLNTFCKQMDKVLKIQFKDLIKEKYDHFEYLPMRAHKKVKLDKPCYYFGRILLDNDSKPVEKRINIMTVLEDIRQVENN